MWLASPALPVGGFSYSEGLEAAVDAGRLAAKRRPPTGCSTSCWLSQARSDLAVVAAAHACWRDATQQDRFAEPLGAAARANRPSCGCRASRWVARLLDWLRNSRQAPIARIAQLAALTPAPTWPLAFALAAVTAGACERTTVLACAFGWAENAAQAAIKAVPIGQAAAQRLLGALLESIPAAADAALATAEPQRQAHAPMLAILSAQHEIQYSRLFRS